jgi:hypothetical protein
LISHVSLVKGSADQINAMGEALEERTLPDLEQRDGFEGMLLLTDLAAGKGLVVGLWSSDQARLAADHEAQGEKGISVSEEVGVQRELLGTFEVRLHRLPPN